MMQIRSRIFAAASVCLLYLAGGSIATAGTILPPGENTFFDNNGQPLSAGCVYFYIPGTLTPKSTFQDAGQTVANTNPVQLDAAGRAIIYGTGTYRQIVKAAPCGSLGVQIWDQLTAATDTSNTIYAGASAGTPNAITVTAPAFSGIDGQVINFISTNTNSGGATFNPSGFGAVQIVRDSATGPGALTGGELVATNAVSLIYDATAGTFHILSPVTWPNTSGVPVGTVISFAGYNAPQNYAFAYGQAVSRTTFSSLFAALTSAQSASLSSGSPTITGLADTAQFGVGQTVEAVGLPAATTIVSCAPTACTLSANATATRTGTVTFFAYGDGDGSTTFNLPDHRDLVLMGRDNMGGTSRGVVTSTYLGSSPTQLGGGGGVQNTTLAAANIPTITASNAAQSITVSLPGIGKFGYTSNGDISAYSGAGSGAFVSTYSPGSNWLFTTGMTTNNSISATYTNGSLTPTSRIQPSAIVNMAIRLVP